MTFTDRRPYEELSEAAHHRAGRGRGATRGGADGATAELTTELAETTDRLTAERAERPTARPRARRRGRRHAAELADRSDRYAGRDRDDRAVRGARRPARAAARGPRRRRCAGRWTSCGANWPRSPPMTPGSCGPRPTRSCTIWPPGTPGSPRSSTTSSATSGSTRGRSSSTKTKVLLDSVVGAGVDGAVELIGPGRAQFAVHAPPIEAEVDARRLATRARPSDRGRRRRRRDGQGAGGRAAVTWTPRSWWRPRSAARSYGSRCAGRTPAATRCTSRSCAGSCRRTAACCRPQTCRA